MNSNFELVYPMFAMVCLTALVGFIMFTSRIYGARIRAVHIRYFKLMKGEIPEFMEKPARHFSNLFETPILFYSACLTAMVTNTVDPTMRNIAWAYVAFRVAHAAIHLGPNSIIPRMLTFIFSFWSMMAIWILIVIRLP